MSRRTALCMASRDASLRYTSLRYASFAASQLHASGKNDALTFFLRTASIGHRGKKTVHAHAELGRGVRYPAADVLVGGRFVL